MKTILKNKFVIIIVLCIVVLIGIFGIKEAIKTDQAHQTFENYYVFRGCIKLLKRTDSYGICKTNQGQTIKIVKFHEKWYLDGDLPTCLYNFCF